MRESSFNLQPPASVRASVSGQDIKHIDKEAFKTQLKVVAIRIPAAKVGLYRKEFQKYTLALPKISSIVSDPDSKDSRLLLLDKTSRDELPGELLDILAQRQIEDISHTITFDYEYWTANQVMKALLPEPLLDDLPTSFTVAGHIAHFNLREEYLPYKYLIGQVTLDKNAAIETVVNKLDTIDNEFRFFQMEVLAGRPDFTVEISESGCRFRFDFSKVYWNSRLQGEHAKLVESFAKEDVICDGFAGVGPFAIPAAKKGCLGVFANDLNPASAEACKENAKRNKVDAYMRCDNMDGRQYFKKAVQDAYNNPFSTTRTSISAKQARRQRELKNNNAGQSSAPTSQSPPPKETTSFHPALGKFIDHFVLNLPATAIDFLDSFQGLYAPFVQGSQADKETFITDLKAYSEARGSKDGIRLPMVHCYCFTKELENYEADICQRASATLGYPVSSDSLKDYSLSLVRSVAPKKDMYRLSFRLPEEVVYKVKQGP